MSLPKKLVIATISFFLASQSIFAFGISFDWGDIRPCTSGNPATINNPDFVLSDVPEGTQKIRFKMVDLNVPSYNHGGGTISYSGETKIASGAFRYKSPCPPDGSHTYLWSAVALDATGQALAIAKAKRQYPE